VLRVSDRGGGMQGDAVERMWWFTGGSDEQEPSPSGRHSSCEKSPLAGRGMGLPLSRAYAAYLNGSLEVVNLPNLGVDAFLFLERIDTPPGLFET
jgi:signal transduction histidine kinase